MLKGFILALAGFVLFLVIHVLLFQIRVPARRFIAMVRIAMAVGSGLILIYFVTPRGLGFLPNELTAAGWAVDLLNSLLVYSFLFIGYCMFYFLVDRGFSGRMMIEIERSPEGRLRAHEIAQRYSLEMVLQRRLNEMLEIGRVVAHQGRYRNSPKGQSAARMFAAAKRFLQLGEGG